MMVIPIVIVAVGTVPKGFEKRLEELEIGGRIVIMQTAEIGQNTEKSPGDLRRLEIKLSNRNLVKQINIWAV